MKELLVGVGLIVLGVGGLVVAAFGLSSGGWYVTPFGLLWSTVQIMLALGVLVIAYIFIAFGWDRWQRERRRRR